MVSGETLKLVVVAVLLLLLPVCAIAGDGVERDSAAAALVLDLRQKALTVAPAELGLADSVGTGVWGVIMETCVDSVSVTLVALAEGSVSLYLGNGSALVGLGEHDGPLAASKDFLAVAGQYVADAETVETFPVAECGQCIFYFKVGDTVRKIVDSEAMLANSVGERVLLYGWGQQVMYEGFKALEEADAVVEMGDEEGDAF